NAPVEDPSPARFLFDRGTSLAALALVPRAPAPFGWPSHPPLAEFDRGTSLAALALVPRAPARSRWPKPPSARRSLQLARLTRSPLISSRNLAVVSMLFSSDSTTRFISPSFSKRSTS